MKEHKQDGTAEGFETTSTSQSETEHRQHESDLESQTKKKVKIENGIKIEFEDSEPEVSLPSKSQLIGLPHIYQEMLLDKRNIKQLQGIVTQSIMSGSDARDSLTKITDQFDKFFEKNTPIRSPFSPTIPFPVELMKEAFNEFSSMFNRALENYATFGGPFAGMNFRCIPNNLHLKKEVERTFLKGEDTVETSPYGHKTMGLGSLMLENLQHYRGKFPSSCKVEESL